MCSDLPIRYCNERPELFAIRTNQLGKCPWEAAAKRPARCAHVPGYVEQKIVGDGTSRSEAAAPAPSSYSRSDALPTLRQRWRWRSDWRCRTRPGSNGLPLVIFLPENKVAM